MLGSTNVYSEPKLRSSTETRLLQWLECLSYRNKMNDKNLSEKGSRLAIGRLNVERDEYTLELDHFRRFDKFLIQSEHFTSTWKQVKFCCQTLHSFSGVLGKEEYWNEWQNRMNEWILVISTLNVHQWNDETFVLLMRLVWRWRQPIIMIHYCKYLDWRVQLSAILSFYFQNRTSGVACASSSIIIEIWNA